MDAIREWWAAIMAAAALGIWLVRLEGAQKTAWREVERLERQMEMYRRDAQESRKEQNEMIREIRADIKRLLERG